MSAYSRHGAGHVGSRLATQGREGNPPAPFGVAMMILLIGLAMIPPFTIATLAPDIRSTFALGDREIGWLVAAFFGSSAVLSRRAGAIAERDGASTSLVISAVMCTISIAGLGLASPNAGMLYVWCVTAGVGNAFAHVSVNLRFVRGVTIHRRGVTFGVKQAAIPVASLASGLAVPLARLLGRWQLVFLVFAVLSASVLMWASIETRSFVAPIGRGASASLRAPLPSRGVLVLIALGALLAVGATTVVAAFLVIAGIAGSLTPTGAALTLVAGSLVAIGSRVGFGWLVDRRVARGQRTGAPSLIVGALLTSMAFLVLMDASIPWRFSVGATIGLGMGWAWHGLIDYSVVRLYPASPGRATGISQAGAYLGGILGPAFGGVYFETFGFETAWRLCALSVACSAASFAMAAVLANRSSEVESL